MSSAIRLWLEELGLARYADGFEADDIDLDVLPSLSEQDLEKLGVSMGHRKKLLRAIAALGGGGAGPPDPTSASPTTSPVGRALEIPSRSENIERAMPGARQRTAPSILAAF